jgi:hypothetical protein
VAIRPQRSHYRRCIAISGASGVPEVRDPAEVQVRHKRSAHAGLATRLNTPVSDWTSTSVGGPSAVKSRRPVLTSFHLSVESCTKWRVRRDSGLKVKSDHHEDAERSATACLVRPRNAWCFRSISSTMRPADHAALHSAQQTLPLRTYQAVVAIWTCAQQRSVTHFRAQSSGKVADV